MLQENLQEMIKTLNMNTEDATNLNMEVTQENKIEETKIDNLPIPEQESAIIPESTTFSEIEIQLTNFYDWFESHAETIHNVSRVKAEVSNINPRDSIIFKVKKGKNDDMELVSFYNPSTRPILNLPPAYLKIFKNDTFEALHRYNDEVYIKSYGVKTGLILISCINIDNKIVPYSRIKIKKDVKTIKINIENDIVNKIRTRLSEKVDDEQVQLLYKQAIKFKDAFTTREKTLEWFLQKQHEVVDINHLLKIDHVLISVI